MPRLLIVCEYPTLNGGERSMLVTLDGVRAAGYDIGLACPPTGPLAEILAPRDFRLIPFELRDAQRRRLPLDVLRNRLRTLIDRAAPDLLHANSLSMSRLAGPVVAELGLPSIGHVRDIVGLTAAAIADINRHTRLLAVSEATRTYHLQAGLDSHKTHVLHNGVCLEAFQPRPPTGYVHRQLGLSEDLPLATSIGQIGMRKGLHLVLQAARRVVAVAPQTHFLIVGERHSSKEEARDYESELHQMAQQPPLARCVHFLGWRNDVAALLNETTVLVHAARQEPFGRVLLEAAAAGVPVVATDVGGTREVFGGRPSVASEPSGGAILVPDDQVGDLAGAIVRIVQSPQLSRQMSLDGRRRAIQRLDSRVTTDRLLQHYHEVLAAG